MPTTDDYDRSEQARMGEDKESGRRSAAEVVLLIVAGAAGWVAFGYVVIRFLMQYRWW